MATFLADKSALARHLTRAEVREALDPLALEEEVATCGIVELELLYSATSPSHYRAYARSLDGMPRVEVSEATVRRALEVQGMLAARSQHRGVSLPDLLVAACAEMAGLTVLHYDRDFDRIAKLTGQPTKWIVPRGSVS
ncbi:MAG TPA: PIN domain nuclease [Solirubrobacterales bacterium]|nr:PIN domain nuclease [Solirubrobacterales bacterium]